MPALLVAYDLVGTAESSERYAALIARIKQYPSWGKVQRSTWIVTTDQPTKTVSEELWRFMHPSDRLFVVALDHQAAWYNAMCKDDWLQANL